MTHTHPLDALLHAVLRAAVRDPSGAMTIPGAGALRLPDGRAVTCPDRGLVQRLMEKAHQAQAAGNPDAPRFGQTLGDATNIGVHFTMPVGLGVLEVNDLFDMESGRRLFIAYWHHIAPGSDATAHQKLACAQWVERFFVDSGL
jgi:hypothetical protein